MVLWRPVTFTVEQTLLHPLKLSEVVMTISYTLIHCCHSMMTCIHKMRYHTLCDSRRYNILKYVHSKWMPSEKMQTQMLPENHWKLGMFFHVFFRNYVVTCGFAKKNWKKMASILVSLRFPNSGLPGRLAGLILPNFRSKSHLKSTPYIRSTSLNASQCLRSLQRSYHFTAATNPQIQSQSSVRISTINNKTFYSPNKRHTVPTITNTQSRTSISRTATSLVSLSPLARRFFHISDIVGKPGILNILLY